MPISWLAGRTGLPVSTIKYCRREGLIPRPAKTAETRGFYTHRHLDHLERVQAIRREGKKILLYGILKEREEVPQHGTRRESRPGKEKMIFPAGGIFIDTRSFHAL